MYVLIEKIFGQARDIEYDMKSLLKAFNLAKVMCSEDEEIECIASYPNLVKHFRSGVLSVKVFQSSKRVFYIKQVSEKVLSEKELA